ncbi:MAG: acetyltransferase [Acidobacteriota bacterium]
MERERIEVGGRGEQLVVHFDPPAAGTGPAILYLHGFGSVQSGEKATFFRARAVEAGLAFCSFDFRGHGESEGSMREISLTRNLEDVAAVHAWLVERGHGPVALFGSSMGGATALWYADSRPGEIVAAVHIAPAVGMLAGFERWAGREGLERWRREGTIRFRNELVEAELGWGLLEDLRDRDIDALARRTAVPTMFLQGKRDATVDWRDVSRFVSLAPPGSIELVLYEDGDHRLTDRKEDLWRRALAFLREHAAA